MYRQGPYCGRAAGGPRGGAVVKWRYALIASVILSLAGVGVRIAGGIPREQPRSLVLTGRIDIGMGADGRLLLLVDIDSGTQPADGLVEHAFRLQGAPALTYSGPGTVTYIRNRVTVRVADSDGWVFTVTGWPMSPPDSALTAYGISGLAHMWGASIHEPADMLFTTLPSTTCSAASSLGVTIQGGTGDPNCQNCTSGGQGVSSCSIDCTNSLCEANCMNGSYACCTCGGYCGCCANQIDAAPHH